MNNIDSAKFAKIKDVYIISSIKTGKEFNAKNLTGYALQEGTSSVWDFYFDENSKKKLPRWWFSEANELMYDPEYHVIYESALEFLGS